MPFFSHITLADLKTSVHIAMTDLEGSVSQHFDRRIDI